MIPLIYIAGCVVAVLAINRTPVLVPRQYPGDVYGTYVMQRAAGLMMMCFMLSGAAIGAVLPLTWSPPGVLARLAALVGGFAGAYIGVRGSWLWTLMMTGYGAVWLLSWVFAS
jgi:hypothetical protein